MTDTLNQVEHLQERNIALEIALKLFMNATSDDNGGSTQMYIDIARNHAKHLLKVAPTGVKREKEK